MENSIMDNLNGILWGLFGFVTVVELFFYFVLRSFRKDPKNAGWTEFFDSLWVAMAVALSLKAVLIQPFTIPSGSMEDTLLVNDYILVNKYTYGYSFLNKTPRFLELNQPKRRDVVVFVYPVDPSKDFIKRCVGLPGDVILYKDKKLFVNGTLQEEPYVKHMYPEVRPRGFYEPYTQEQHPEPGSALSFPNSSRDNFGPVTVEAGHYFMMGDNRDNSWDSRYWGPVDAKKIKGRAWVIYWHSVSMGTFIVLATLAAILFCLYGCWELRPKRGKPLGLEEEKARVENVRNYLYISAFCLVVAVFMFGRIGMGEFKDNLAFLKSRMFTVIK